VFLKFSRRSTRPRSNRPPARANFHGQLVDVIAEGLPIERAQTIVVVKARGNRVMVRAVDA
jgi:hypothetical protein